MMTPAQIIALADRLARFAADLSGGGHEFTADELAYVAARLKATARLVVADATLANGKGIISNDALGGFQKPSLTAPVPVTAPIRGH